jgi:vitamin B12 transporter
LFLSDLPPPPVAAEAIVVTAARGGERRDSSPASISLIEPATVERLGEPLLANLLRLTPSASLSVTGPSGSQTQLRLRGAEANHTLLFIDGIRANDPAAGNEPRFELLSADLADRVEIVRGPQSALWGSEAIGGVVAVSAAPRSGVTALGETGSNGFGRLGGSAGLKQGDVTFGIGGGVQGADGINAFAGGAGDRDGYRNGVLRGRLDWQRGPLTLSVSGFGIAARSEFDGLDRWPFPAPTPPTFPAIALLPGGWAHDTTWTAGDWHSASRASARATAISWRATSRTAPAGAAIACRRRLRVTSPAAGSPIA